MIMGLNSPVIKNARDVPNMKPITALLCSGIWAGLSMVLSAGQTYELVNLLPADTVIVVGIADCAKLRASLSVRLASLRSPKAILTAP